MTETEQIDEILIAMSKGQLIGTSKDDSLLEISAIKKLVAFGLISPRSNTFDLTGKGYKAVELGGFQQFLDFQEKQRQQSTSQHLTINAPVTASQLGLSSDFGYLELSHNSINLEPAIAKQQPIDTSNIKTNFSIWDKIYKWTDHKLFSMIAYGLLYALATAFAGWLGWTIFK